MEPLERITITCIDTGVQKSCEILSKTTRNMKVVLPDTTITIHLHRDNPTKPYIGYHGKLEFSAPAR